MKILNIFRRKKEVPTEKKPPKKEEFEPKYQIRYLGIDSSFLFQEITVEILNLSEWRQLSHDERCDAWKLIEEKEKIKIYSWSSGDMRRGKKALGDDIILKETPFKLDGSRRKQSNGYCCLSDQSEGGGGGGGGGDDMIIRARYI